MYFSPFGFLYWFYLGLAGYHGVGGVTGTSVYRSSIPKGNERSFKRWGWGHGGYGGHGYGHGHGGWGYAAPYGHPITHPGFTSIGFPGHALASFDVKNRIAQKRGKQKRQIVAPSFGSPLAPFTMPAAVPAPFPSAVAPLALPATYHAPLFTPVAHPVAAIPSFSSLPAATSIPAVPATLPVGCKKTTLTLISCVHAFRLCPLADSMVHHDKVSSAPSR